MPEPGKTCEGGAALLRGVYPSSDPLLKIATDLRRCLPARPMKEDERAAAEAFDRLLGPLPENKEFL